MKLATRNPRLSGAQLGMSAQGRKAARFQSHCNMTVTPTFTKYRKWLGFRIAFVSFSTFADTATTEDETIATHSYIFWQL